MSMIRFAAVLALLPQLALAQTAPRPPQRPPAAPAPAAPAATPAAPAAADGDRSWSVVCTDATQPGGQRNCRLAAVILMQPQNQRLAQVILTRQPETGSLGMVFQLPHGAALPTGIAWQVDEAAAQRLAFQTSDPEGLYAGVPVADDLLGLLRRGTTLKLTFVVAARREAVTIPIPLGQFPDAFTEFLAAERAPATPAAPARR